uniref:DUF4939 domain-containing protein n=1 Tax=Esox lucius TaxID=8010 RepID=A0A3P8Y167_ESOLU
MVGRALLSQQVLLRLLSLTVTLPETYDGNPEGCRGFLLQCELYFGNQLYTDYEKVTTIITLLTGCALKWGVMVGP